MSSIGIPRAFLALLRCPYCGFQLETEATDANGADVRYGILRCACHEYPIVEGIPILQQIDGLQRVVQRVRDADPRGALLRALDLFRVQWAHRSKFHRLQYHWNCSRLVSRSDASFCDAAQLVRRPRVFADYLVHRYANPSFLAAVGPLLVLVRTAKTTPDADAASSNIASASASAPAPARPVRILDLACGAGHASHLMRLLGPDLSVVSADQDFVNLYLARRYLVPDGLHLCIDAQVTNPLPDGFFDAVYCQDAFHYFRSKKAAVNELKRVARPNALWVFPHLHNRLCQNLVPGLPLSPGDYLQCFELPGARLFAESELLLGLVSNRVVDLRASVAASVLDQAPTLTLISGGNEVWRDHREFPQALCRQAPSLQVNPIYHARSERDGVLLERRWPNPVMARECAEAQTVLPQSCRLSAEQLSQLRAGWVGAYPEWLEDMVARFVLVPLPPGYSRAPVVGDEAGPIETLAGPRARSA